MEHIDKKRKIIDISAKSVVLYNLDLMAVISSFLKWEETVPFILVCKAWHKSFNTRPWGSLKSVYLPFVVADRNESYKSFYLSVNHIKFAEHISLFQKKIEDWIPFILPIKFKYLSLNDVKGDLGNLKALAGHKLEKIGMSVSKYSDYMKSYLFLEQHMDTITHLRISYDFLHFLLQERVVIRLPVMLNLTKLQIVVNLANFNIFIFKNLVNYPKLKCVELDYEVCDVDHDEKFIEDLYENIVNTSITQFKLGISVCGGILLNSASMYQLNKIVKLLKTNITKLYISIYSSFDNYDECVEYWRSLSKIDINICHITVELTDKSDMTRESIYIKNHQIPDKILSKMYMENEI